jgi:membrane-bound serine protease (ClpP class)
MIFCRLFTIILCLFISPYSKAQPANELVPLQFQIPVLSINTAIGPAVSEYIITEISNAQNKINIPLIIITIDTPGGLSSSLRQINQHILNSHIPIACLVYPKGARAASAGTYILYACHYAAMTPATTLGAATPVNMITPSSAPDDESKKHSTSAIKEKVLNDAIAYIRSLAQLRNRNEKWAEIAVSEAATLTAEEALKKNVINYLTQNPQDLLANLIQANKLTSDVGAIKLENTQLITIQPNWRNRFIAMITDPNIAYILLLIGIYGLALEFYSPGLGVAGITGIISLLIAVYAFQLLPLSFSGIALILLGIGLLIAESVMPSFGVFGVGGTIAFVFGSIFLIDTEHPQFLISIPLIAAIAFVSVLFFVFSLGVIWRKRKSKIVSGQEELLGALAFAEDNFIKQGFVIFNGERWAALFTHPVKKGQAVTIDTINGLVLTTTPSLKKEF